MMMKMINMMKNKMKVMRNMIITGWPKHFLKKPVDFYKKSKVLGEAFAKDDCLGLPSNKKFVINLEWSKLGKRVLQCLAHEMVHVKQYAKGELKFHEKGNMVTFQREQYQGDEYWESLWEIEAYGREVGLYQKFRPTFKLLKKEI